MHTDIAQCRICGNTDLVEVLNLGEQALTGVFPRSREQQITRGPLQVVACRVRDEKQQCGLVQLRQTYELNEMYGENYGYRSSLNRSMVEHLRSKTQWLQTIAPLRQGDLVLDIGSNDGTLLSFYPQVATLCGIDPTAAKFRQYYQPHIEVIADFFSAELVRRQFGSRGARLITSIAMFYDLCRPMDFVRHISEVLAPDGIWHFEQSYLPLMLATNAYDTVCHEHQEFYALQQIQWMVQRCGMKILDVQTNDINGGSFAVTVARTDSKLTANTQHVEAMLAEEHWQGLHTLAPYTDFACRVAQHRDKLMTLLLEMKKQGKKVLGYGASTKGNVVLQYCGITPEVLSAIAEVNPDKFGCFTPGSRIPIISETDAKQMKPDAFVVFPWHFRDNLVQREAAYLKAGGKMIFPLPQIEVVG